MQKNYPIIGLAFRSHHARIVILSHRRGPHWVFPAAWVEEVIPSVPEARTC
jgi:hypothetical protein